MGPSRAHLWTPLLFTPVNAGRILHMPRTAKPEGEIQTALNWFAWYTLHYEASLGSAREKEIRDILSSSVVSQSMRHARAIGLEALVGLAKLTRQDPGQFLDAALRWWREKGQSVRDAAMQARTNAVARGEKDPGLVPPGILRKTSSGTYEATQPPVTAATEERPTTEPPPNSARRPSRPSKPRKQA